MNKNDFDYAKKVCKFSQVYIRKLVRASFTSKVRRLFSQKKFDEFINEFSKELWWRLPSEAISGIEPYVIETYKDDLASNKKRI